MRIQFDRQLALQLAHHLHLGDTRYRAEVAGDAGVGQPGQFCRREIGGGQRQRHNGPVGVVQLPDDRLFHLVGKVVPHLRDGVADVLGRLQQRLLEQELDHDEAEAVLGPANDLLHPADRGDRFLDRVEHFLLDPVRRSAGIYDAHRHKGRGNVGKLVGLQPQQREYPEHHQRQHGDDGDDGATDGEV